MIFTQTIQEGGAEVACRSDIGREVEVGQSVDVAVGKDEERGWDVSAGLRSGWK